MIHDPDRDRHHSTELGLTSKAFEALVEEVAIARGMTSHDIRHGGKTREFVLARRATCVVGSDLFMLGHTGYSPVSWTSMAKSLCQARSTLHHSEEKWRNQEGAEDGEREASLREAGHLMPVKESIHEMARRVCKRGMRYLPDGKRKELGYWSSKGAVNDG
jgi:hypothetical protein